MKQTGNMISMRGLSDLASTSSSTFQRLWKPLWKVLSLSPADDAVYPSKHVAVSIERGRLSVAYGSRFFSKISIRKYREYTIEEQQYPQPDFLSSSLALALNEFGVSGTDITLCIPKAWTIIQTVELPVSVLENLPEVLSFELDRLTPFSADDAFYDYRIIGTNSEKLRLMIIAVRADMIKPYVETLKERDISLARISVDMTGFQTLLQYMDISLENAVFLSISDDEYEGALFAKSAVTDSFTGTFSSEDDQEKVEILKTKCAPLFENLKKLSKSTPFIVLIRDVPSSLKELLRQNSTLPVTFINEADIKVNILEKNDTIPYGTIGCLLESIWPKAHRPNLLTKGFHAKETPPKLLTIILLCIIIGIWIVYLIAPLSVESRRLQAIDQQIALRKDEVMSVESVRTEIQALQKDIDTIYSFKHSKPSALNIVKELTTILPNNTWLTRVRLTDTVVQIEGYATSASGLLPKLESSPYFQKAEFAAPTFRDARMNADRFNIKAEIEGISSPEPSHAAGAEQDDEE